MMATATPRPRSPVKAHQVRRGQSNAANEMRGGRHRYGLSQTLMARLLDVSLRTISSAESGVAVPVQLRRSLTQVSRLCEALTEVMEPLFVGQWLDQPNEMLGGLKPVEAIERGQIDIVWQVVDGLRFGSSL